MNLLPWKNPLVVTSFLLRARRGGFFTTTVLYLALLVMGYGAWNYFISTNPKAVRVNPNMVVFLILYCGQCLLSAIFMLQSASNSIKIEVLNKTLDFQRIAAVSPWDILLGKLLGNPTLAYLLAIAAFPMGFFCMLNGIPGVGVLEVVLLWLQLLTFLFLLGSATIQHSLQATTGRHGGASVSFNIFIGVLGLLIFSSFSAGDARSFLVNPLRVTLPALLSPLTAISGVYVGDPWAAKFYFFSLEIPCLLFTPIAHLAIAWFILNIMARRLQSIDNSPLGKRLTYLFLVVADLLVVGALQSTGRAGPLGAAGLPVQIQVGTFLCLHMILAFIAMGAVTPKREAFFSWIWRFRGNHTALRDAFLHDRTLNTAPIIVAILTGLVGLALLVITGQGGVTADFLVEAAALTAAVIFFWGLTYQWFVLVSGKYGPSFFFLFLIFTTGIPMIAGMIIASDLRGPSTLSTFLLHLTPIAQFPLWYSDGERGNAPGWLKVISAWPVTIGYLMLGIWIWVLIQRRLNQLVRRVHQTKEEMEIHSPIPTQHPNMAQATI
jgi:hypothetical protein